MTNDEQQPDPAALPAPVTGVARGGQGTGTALDDTQVYDVAEFTPAPLTPEAPPPAPQPAPVIAPVAQPAPRAVTRRRASSDRRPRVGVPLAGVVGFAIAAGLAILIGASLGGITAPGGAANGDATPGATATGAPAATEATDGDGGGGGDGDGKGCGNGKGKGKGNCDDD